MVCHHAVEDLSSLSIGSYPREAHRSTTWTRRSRGSHALNGRAAAWQCLRTR
jgi:hypothetical protein